MRINRIATIILLIAVVLLSSCTNVKSVPADFITIEGDNITSPISSAHFGIDIRLDMGDGDICYQVKADNGMLFFEGHYAYLMAIDDGMSFQWTPIEYQEDNFVDIIAYDYDRIVGCGIVKISKCDDGWMRGEVVYCVTYNDSEEIDEETVAELMKKAKK